MESVDKLKALIASKKISRSEAMGLLNEIEKEIESKIDDIIADIDPDKFNPDSLLTEIGNPQNLWEATLYEEFSNRILSFRNGKLNPNEIFHNYTLIS
jgi:hypothetical protein